MSKVNWLKLITFVQTYSLIYIHILWPSSWHKAYTTQMKYFRSKRNRQLVSKLLGVHGQRQFQRNYEEASDVSLQNELRITYFRKISRLLQILEQSNSLICSKMCVFCSKYYFITIMHHKKLLLFGMKFSREQNLTNLSLFFRNSLIELKSGFNDNIFTYLDYRTADFYKLLDIVP